MCISKCTGQEFTVHSIGCDEQGELICIECGSTFTGTELKREFLERFDWRGEMKLLQLRKLAGAIKRVTGKYTQVHDQLAGVRFFVDPPVNAVDHTSSTLKAGRHFNSQPHE